MNRTAYRAYALVAIMVSSFFLASEATAKENILVGKRFFNAYCSLCHGEDGTGNGQLTKKLSMAKPVADLTIDKYQSMSVDEVLALIQGYSRDNSQMPKWETVIPERNLRNVAAYVLLLNQKDIRMRGDVRRGREIFRQTCVACHGPRGEGNGVLAKILEVKMINFRTKALAEVTDATIIRAITSGQGELMPSWSGTLSSEEIKDAAAFIRSLYKRNE